MLDPAMFKDFPDISEGDRVRYVTKQSGERVEGEGTVQYIWFGIDEMCKIERDGGGTVDVCRGIGDEVTAIGGPT